MLHGMRYDRCHLCACSIDILPFGTRPTANLCSCLEILNNWCVQAIWFWPSPALSLSPAPPWHRQLAVTVLGGKEGEPSCTQDRSPWTHPTQCQKSLLFPSFSGRYDWTQIPLRVLPTRWFDAAASSLALSTPVIRIWHSAQCFRAFRAKRRQNQSELDSEIFPQIPMDLEHD